MYNNRYDDRARGRGGYDETRDTYPPAEDYGARSNFRDDYPRGSSGKRGSSGYSDRIGDAGPYSGSAPKRSRGMAPVRDEYMDAGRSNPAILDTPYERNMLLAEEERLRHLEELAQLKREHELTLLRRQLDINRREVQAVMGGRDVGPPHRGGSYDRDARGPPPMDFDRRRGGVGGLHDRDARSRDRLRGREEPRGPPRRERSPVRRRSPVQKRLGSRGRSPPRRARERDGSRTAASRERSEARRNSNQSANRSGESTTTPKCELCKVSFKTNDEKTQHEEKDEKHVEVMKKLREFSESSGKPVEELLEKFLKSRAKSSTDEQETTTAPGTTESKDGAKDNAEDKNKKAADPEAEKYPGLFYTGERWRVRVYNADLILGSDFIVPATGFYCVLCQKFYYSESPAKTSHCRTKLHWENLRAWLKTNGHRYEPNQYDKFVEEEEKYKEELKKKKMQEGGIADNNEEESKEKQNDGDGGEDSKNDSFVINSEIESSNQQEKDDKVEEAHLDQSATSFEEAMTSEEPNQVTEVELSPPKPNQSLGGDEVLDFDEFEEDEDFLRGEDDNERSPSKRSSSPRRVIEKREAVQSGTSGRKIMCDDGRRQDAEMYSVFDNIEAMLNNQSNEEIQVNVVDDPFNSHNSEFLDHEEENRFEEELPPTEEIDDQYDVLPTSEINEDDIGGGRLADGQQNISHEEEDEEFIVHEEEEYETEQTQQQSVPAVQDITSKEPESEQIDVASIEVEDKSEKKSSPVARRGGRGPIQTARRGNRGRGR